MAQNSVQESAEPAYVPCRLLLSLGIAVALTVAVNAWVRHSELVAGSFVIAGMPLVPSVAFLLVAVPLTLAGRRLGFRVLSRSEILLIYMFLNVAVFMSTFGVARALFPCLTAPFYFATPENRFAEFWRFIPDWFLPKDLELIRLQYEGMAMGVPWLAWLPHLLIWIGFFTVLFFTLLSLIVLFRKPWVENERLSFPMLYLPLELTVGLDSIDEGDHGLIRNLFFSPLMWFGFAIVTGFHCLNITHAFNPSVPAPGMYFNMGQLFTERPLSAVQPLVFSYEFETIGFGYLVPMEILFSLWFFYIMGKLTAVLGSIGGYEAAGFPYQQEQSAGAYIALFLILVWSSRAHIASVGRRLMGGPQRDPQPGYSGENEAWAVPVAIIGFTAVIAFAWLAGMALPLALIFMGLIVAFAVVCARVRAEAGLPIIWPYPYDQQKEMIVNIAGTPLLARQFGMRSLTLLSTFSFLSRHYFPYITQDQLDNLRLADDARISRRRIMAVMIFAMLFGLFCAFAIHLSAYYEFGENVLEGSPQTGGFRARVALQEFTRMFDSERTPRLPVAERSLAYGLGFAITVALAWLRYRFLQSPFSPLGYAVANAYGSLSPYWGPFFVVWFLKAIILKTGGAPLYRKLVPFFLGLVLGQYFMGAIVWTTISVFVSPEIASRYRFSLGG